MPLLTEKEAAEFLNVSRSYLAKARMNGPTPDNPTPPFKRIGARMIRYCAIELADYANWTNAANDSCNDPETGAAAQQLPRKIGHYN